MQWRRNNIILYGAATACLAALYAILTATGSRLSADGIVAGGITYWVVYGLVGIALWSVFKYAVPTGSGILKRFITVSSGVMTILLVTGAETLAVYIAIGGLDNFLPLLPLKVFVSVLIFIILCLFHRRGMEEKPEYEEPAPAEVVQPDSDSVAAPQEETIERITVRVGSKIKVIAVGDVEYLQAEGDYVAVVTGEGRWLKEQTMKYFEEHLPAADFIRIHRSYIVQMSKISRIERYGTIYHVILGTGEKIKVSATGYKLLKERLRL
jgi:hypothetical protein